MTKYLFYIIGLWLFCSCSDSTPGEEPPVTPPEPTPTITISKPEFVFGFTGESKYSYCPSALKQEDGSVHLFFCGNPENQIMVDNIFHIKINSDGSQTAPKSNRASQAHGTIITPATLPSSRAVSAGTT